MRQSVTSPNLQRIRAVVQQIVERFHPERVFLFGSYAHGRPTPDSDVDLLVVLDTPTSPLRCAAQISQAIDHPFPVDIVVMTPGEWAEYLDEGAIFPTQVSKKGLLLYEAGDARVG